MRLTWDGIQWGEWRPGDYQFYFFWWNWLPRGSRYLGTKDYFYDQPHRSFGFWFFNWSWSTRWTPWPQG